MNKYLSKHKGGRPPKIIKRNILLGVKCSQFEQMQIKLNAQNYNITVSEYLRNLGLDHKVTLKTLPHEVIMLQTRLNQICSLLNQLARKRNINDQLNAIDRAEVKNLVFELQDIITLIRNYVNDSKS